MHYARSHVASSEVRAAGECSQKKLVSLSPKKRCMLCFLLPDGYSDMHFEKCTRTRKHAHTLSSEHGIIRSAWVADMFLVAIPI